MDEPVSVNDIHRDSGDRRRHPLGESESPVAELATVERSGFVESRHFGAAVVVDASGTVIREIGDSSADVFGRSTLKLLQAIAVLRSGVDLADERLVLASASHAGTPRHVRVVHDMLDSAGLDEAALGCPPAWPTDADAAFDARAAGAGPTPITMNCSGKHAAFLLGCARNGWSLDGYLDREHPLQRLVRSTIEDFTGDAVAGVGVDGCGAPVFATTLAALATGIARVSGGTDAHSAALTAAILAHPWAIDGPGRANTVVAERLGIVAKGGAEGVMVMGTTDGTAVAVKVIDGSPRATTLVALELLVSVGAIGRADADSAIDATTNPVLGGSVVVGAIRPSF